MSNTTPPPPPPGPGQDPFQPQSTDPTAMQPPAPPQQPAYGSAPASPAYGAMPGTPTAAPTGPITAPQTILNAVKLMRVGAGLSLLSLLVPITMRGQMKEIAEQAAAASGSPVDPAVIDPAVTLITVGIGFGAVIGLALWLWMASANGKGKSWARVVSTVFFGFSILSFLSGLVQPTPMLSKLLAFVTVLVGGAALFFLYKPESKAFYEANSRPRV